MVDGASRLDVLRTVIAPLLAPGHRRHGAVRVHHRLERVLLRPRPAPDPGPDDAAAAAGAVRRHRGHRPARPARRERAARDAAEPPLLRHHPALADARPPLRGGQGLVSPLTQPERRTFDEEAPRAQHGAGCCASPSRLPRRRPGKSKQNVVNLNVRDLRLAADHGRGDERRSSTRGTRPTPTIQVHDRPGRRQLGARQAADERSSAAPRRTSSTTRPRTSPASPSRATSRT